MGKFEAHFRILRRSETHSRHPEGGYLEKLFLFPLAALRSSRPLQVVRIGPRFRKRARRGLLSMQNIHNLKPDLNEVISS